MRTKFIPQMTFGTVPIAEIEFDVFSRHELVPILMTLQHLHVNWGVIPFCGKAFVQSDENVIKAYLGSKTT